MSHRIVHSSILAGLALAAAASFAFAGDPRAEAAPLHVRLKPLALVHQRQVALHDIAEVSGSDEEAVRQLGSVQLTRAPRLGYTEQLSLEAIRRVVRARFGEGDEAIVWEGGKAVKIETAAVPYDGRLVVEAAIDQVRRTLPARRYQRVEIRPEGAPPAISLPAGEVSLHARDIALAKLARSRVGVWVDVALDGEFYRSVIVSLRLELIGAALVARRDLPRGHIASAEDFESRQIDLAALPTEAAATDSVAGRRLSRPVSAGDVLVQASLEDLLAVGAGDTVTLRLSNGAVQIESQARALSAGAVGQIVKVRPGASDAEIPAEVLAPGVVKLSSRH